MKLKRVLVNLLLLLGTFLCCILVLEVGLRLLFPQPMTRARVDPDLGWFHAAKAQFTYTRQEFSTSVGYNSFGLWDSEHPLQKPPGSFASRSSETPMSRDSRFPWIPYSRRFWSGPFGIEAMIARP